MISHVDSTNIDVMTIFQQFSVAYQMNEKQIICRTSHIYKREIFHCMTILKLKLTLSLRKEFPVLFYMRDVTDVYDK